MLPRDVPATMKICQRCLKQQRRRARGAHVSLLSPGCCLTRGQALPYPQRSVPLKDPTLECRGWATRLLFHKRRTMRQRTKVPSQKEWACHRAQQAQESKRNVPKKTAPPKNSTPVDILHQKPHQVSKLFWCFAFASIAGPCSLFSCHVGPKVVVDA